MKTALISAACAFAAFTLTGCQSTPQQAVDIPWDAPGSSTPLASAPVGNPVQVSDVEGVSNFYIDGPISITSQPSAAALQGFAQRGVKVVVNFRTDGEMDKLDFDEAELCAEAGLEYIRIPIGGAEKYTPEALAEFARVMETHDGKALLHCRSGGRVTNFYVAYLVKYRGYGLNEAYEVGLNLRYRPTPLEQLLDRKIQYHFVD